MDVGRFGGIDPLILDLGTTGSVTGSGRFTPNEIIAAKEKQTSL
jgi:hypothetical protein